MGQGPAEGVAADVRLGQHRGGPRTQKLLFSWLVPSPRATRAIFGDPIDLTAYYDRPRNRQTLEEVRDVIQRHVVALSKRRGYG